MPNATNRIDGERVYFEDDAGTGPPVVVLGGFLDPIELVRRAPLVRALAQTGDDFRLVFIDHRGHGRSGAPHRPEAYAMPVRVADVVAVLDAAEVDRAHVVGLSWGGRLALGIGEHAPERTRSLIVVGQQPYAIDPHGPLARVVAGALGGPGTPAIEPLIASFEAIAGPYPPQARRLYLSSDAAAMQAAWRAVMAEGAVSDRLGQWRLPVLLCVGAGDADFGDQARRAATEIPDAEFVIVEDTDHLGMDTADAHPALPAVLRTMQRGDRPPPTRVAAREASVEPRIETRSAQPYAAIASTTSMRDGGFGPVIDSSLPAVLEHLASIDVEPTGPPLVIYRVIDMSGDLEIEVGWPVASEIAPHERVGTGTLAAGRYVVGTHVGSFDGLENANAELQDWAKGQGVEWAMHGERWDARYESYLSDLQTEPDPSGWRTDILYLLAD